MNARERVRAHRLVDGSPASLEAVRQSDLRLEPAGRLRLVAVVDPMRAIHFQVTPTAVHAARRMATFETRIPRKSASCHAPKVSVSRPKTKRIPFGTFSVFARTMLAYDRLERWRGSLPRAARRRAASTSFRPVVAARATAAIG